MGEVVLYNHYQNAKIMEPKIWTFINMQSSSCSNPSVTFIPHLKVTHHWMFPLGPLFSSKYLKIARHSSKARITMIQGGLGGALSQHPVVYLSVLPRYGMNDWGFPTTKCRNNLIPYMHIILHWKPHRMFTEVLMWSRTQDLNELPVAPPSACLHGT